MSGAEVVGGSSESFKTFIATDRAQWGRVARAINLTVD
jgi:hypothetical protein